MKEYGSIEGKISACDCQHTRIVCMNEILLGKELPDSNNVLIFVLHEQKRDILGSGSENVVMRNIDLFDFCRS